MIKIDISTALFIYLTFNVIGVLLLWAFYDIKVKKPALWKDDDFVWRCAICAKTYVDSKSERMSKCPQCGSYNAKQDRKK